MLSISETDWLKKYYPELTVSIEGFYLNGELHFKATYNKEINKFQVLYPNSENAIGGIVLEKSYQLLIKERPTDDPTGIKLPGLFIREGQIDLITERHINMIDKSACFCAPIEEEKYLEEGFHIQTFLNHLIIPFLYAQTYYDSFLCEWPWGQYGHGTVGILESYFQNEDSKYIKTTIYSLSKDTKFWPYLKNLLVQKELIKGHLNCLCGSGDYIRRCHPDAWHGINKLKSGLIQNSVEI